MSTRRTVSRTGRSLGAAVALGLGAASLGVVAMTPRAALADATPPLVGPSVFETASLAPPLSLNDQRYAFEVSWSMFPKLTLATGEIHLRSVGEGYDVDVTARARLGGTPIDWRGEFKTRGALSASELRPINFVSRSVRRPGKPDQQTVVATVDWTKGDAPVSEIVRTPNRVDPSRPVVDVSQAGEVVDPLTFVVGMLARVVRTDGADCTTLNRTWDGERLAVIQTETGERVPAARIDCRVVYKALLGLSSRNNFRVKEDETQRIVRFRKSGGRWRPEFLKIQAVLVSGLTTTFTTKLTPMGPTGG